MAGLAGMGVWWRLAPEERGRLGWLAGEQVAAGLEERGGAAALAGRCGGRRLIVALSGGCCRLAAEGGGAGSSGWPGASWGLSVLEGRRLGWMAWVGSRGWPAEGGAVKAGGAGGTLSLVSRAVDSCGR